MRRAWTEWNLGIRGKQSAWGMIINCYTVY